MPPTLYMSVCVLVLFSIRSGGLSVASDRSIAMVACVACTGVVVTTIVQVLKPLAIVNKTIISAVHSKQRLQQT
jgi:hypothetical protein